MVMHLHMNIKPTIKQKKEEEEVCSELSHKNGHQHSMLCESIPSVDKETFLIQQKHCDLSESVLHCSKWRNQIQSLVKAFSIGCIGQTDSVGWKARSL